MSMHKDSPAEPGTSPASRLLRRRIVFELTEQQLPLLEAAEARHGSKRAALLASLEADARLAAVEHELAAAERALAQRQATATRESGQSDKAKARLERELKQARAALKKAEADVASARADASDVERDHAQERDELYEAIETQQERIADLAERAFDSLYCARCGKWARADEWAWADARNGGEYAFHEPCGDHGPGILGQPPSWLASRER
jgi:hypothetical protein